MINLSDVLEFVVAKECTSCKRMHQYVPV